MCVKKVQAFEHAGKLFATEEDALKAALKDIADLLMKDHSAKLHDGLLAVSPKLRSVLDRLAAIEKLKPVAAEPAARFRSEEHTSELQSLMRISYAVFCLQKNKQATT